MKVLAALWAVSLVRLCHCGELGNLRKGVVDVPLDLSSPDPSFVRDYESTVDGVVYQSFFSNGLFFNKVVDGGVTLWEAEGEEKCSVLFTSVGNGKSRVILHVWVKGIPSRMMHYEKLDGEWKLVTVRVKGLPESEEPVSPQEHAAELDFASLGCPLGGCSGSEAKPKVTLPPTESNNNGEDASENKVEGGTPDDEEESGESQPKEVDKEEPDQQSGDNAAGPVTDPQESRDIPPDSPANDSSCQPQTEDTEQTAVSSSDPVDQQPTEVNELQESEPLQSTESPQEVAYQQSEAPLEDPKPVSNEEESSNEQEELGDLDDQDSEETLVEEVQPEVAPAESPEDDEPGNGSEKEFGDSESTGYESSDNNLPETKVEEPEEPTKPANSSLSKVDSSLFHVEEAEEDAVKVLKLTPKKGAKATKLTYEGLTVWEDKKKSCLSAVLYMDGEKPTLAVIKTKGFFGGESTIYKYYDDKEWKSCKEKDHNVGLKKLKKKYKPSTPITLDLTKPDKSKINVYKEEDGVKFEDYSPKDAFHISSVVDSGGEIWKAEGANEKSTFVQSHTKGSTLITIGIKNGNNYTVKYFEKTVNGKWVSIDKEEFDKKLKDLKNGVTNPSTTLPS